jgi:hypothetical protein
VMKWLSMDPITSDDNRREWQFVVPSPTIGFKFNWTNIFRLLYIHD